MSNSITANGVCLLVLLRKSVRLIHPSASQQPAGCVSAGRRRTLSDFTQLASLSDTQKHSCSCEIAEQIFSRSVRAGMIFWCCSTVKQENLRTWFTLISTVDSEGLCFRGVTLMWRYSKAASLLLRSRDDTLHHGSDGPTPPPLVQ